MTSILGFNLYFCDMTGLEKNIVHFSPKAHVVLDLSDDFTCSFPEFIPFCHHLYFYSSIKVFNKLAQA